MQSLVCCRITKSIDGAQRTTETFISPTGDEYNRPKSPNSKIIQRQFGTATSGQQGFPSVHSKLLNVVELAHRALENVLHEHDGQAHVLGERPDSGQKVVGLQSLEN